MDKKDFLDLRDYDKDTLLKLINRAIELKAGQEAAMKEGKALALIFTKASTRTNVSFQRAIQRLGGEAIYLGSESLQLSRGETIADTARTLSRYVDCIMIRTYSHQDVLDLAGSATIPVINGLTDLLHPCQALGDIMTITEEKGTEYDNIKVAFIGDGNNVCNSLINAAGIFGFELAVSGPTAYPPDQDILKQMQEGNKKIRLVQDPGEAVSGADVIYTDVWVSMGDDKDKTTDLDKFKMFQVNTELLKKAKPDVIVMHCLPAHRGEEITNEVMDGPNSVVFDQAENRMHVQEAILEFLM